MSDSDMPGTGRLAHAQPDNPPVKRASIGVLLANLGTPDGHDYWSMRRYLSEFPSDKRVIDYPSWKWQPLLQTVILAKRPFTSGANYRLIWNEATNERPLMTITKAQTAAIAAALKARHGEALMVDFCIRYGNPSTEAKVRAMVAVGCEKILFFPLYPHYAGASSATQLSTRRVMNAAAVTFLLLPQWPRFVRSAPASSTESQPANTPLSQAAVPSAAGSALHRSTCSPFAPASRSN